MDAYAEALCVHLARQSILCAAYTVDTVYFGGGTPSLMGRRRLARIWNAVTANYHLSPDAEITLEANPDSAGEWLGDLYAAGFNRISLGMQSARNRELREIGRIHTCAGVQAAVETIRRAGFENLSLDLIYGLPGQTMDSWENSLRAALDLKPEHLSCYGLKLEAGTPLYERRKTLSFPDADQQADFYLSAVETLDRYGYRQYEISNFARPDRESRHNLKYWTLVEYLGFGPGAHSDFGGVRYAYARDLQGYIDGVQSGFSAPSCVTKETDCPVYAEWTAIPPLERARERIMLGLRTARGVDMTDHTLDFSRCENFFRQCEQAGYLRREDGRIFLTPRGFLLSNPIIGEILELLFTETFA